MKITVEIELGKPETPYDNWKKTRPVLSVKVNGKTREEADDSFDLAENTWNIFSDDIYNLSLIRSE